MHEDHGVAQHLLDAEVEHDAVAAVQLDRVLGDLHDLFGSKQLGHVDQRLGFRRIVVHGLCGALEQRAHRLDFGRHFGEPQRHRLMLDQDAAALHVVLHILRRRLEGAHADAEVLGRLDDLAGTEIDAGRTHRAILHQQVIVRHEHVLEHHFAVVHETAAERLVAACDREPFGFARHQERRGALQHADLGIAIGVDHVEAGVVAVGDELLAAVDHPAASRLHGLGLHRRFRHVVRQPAVGGAARLGQAMRHQELRLRDQALEPFLLQMLGRELAQQHRHFPILHHLVGQAGIAARDFLGDQGESFYFRALLEFDAAELLRHAQGADADLLGLFQDADRQPVLRHHRPFALPILLDEGQHHLIDEIAAALPHHPLFF